MTKDPNVVQTEAIQAIREAIYQNSNYRHLMEMFSIGRNSGTFQSLVNTQELPSVTKFTYLKEILTRQAASAISGIAVMEENYAIALCTLCDKYGRKDVIVESLYASLQKI